MSNIYLSNLSKKTPNLTFFYVFILILIFLFLDLLSKHLFYNMNLFSNLSLFKATCNTWISFSIPIPVFVVMFVTLISLFIFIYFYIKKKIPWRIFIFLIAGTVGNLIDRVYLWCVRDFIVFWPLFIFNLADLFLNLWVIWIIFIEFFGLRKKSTDQK